MYEGDGVRCASERDWRSQCPTCGAEIALEPVQTAEEAIALLRKHWLTGCPQPAARDTMVSMAVTRIQAERAVERMTPEAVGILDAIAAANDTGRLPTKREATAFDCGSGRCPAELTTRRHRIIDVLIDRGFVTDERPDGAAYALKATEWGRWMAHRPAC